MRTFGERANGLRWRWQAMRRLWSAGAEPEMTFLPPEAPEAGVLGEIDHPPPSFEVEGETLTVSGWVAFEAGPTSKVEILLDDELIGRARLGLPREDVEETNEIANAGVSGFELVSDLHHPPVGARTVRVVATGPGGSRHEMGPVPIAIVAANDDSQSPPPAPLPARPTTRGEGLRLLVITHQLNLGGAQLYLMDLLQGLLERGGIAPTVVCPMDGPLREDLEAMGIGVHITSVSPFDDLSSHQGRVEELVAWAEPHRFEAALVNTATSLSFPGADAAAQLGLPTVWAIHESFEPAVLWGHLDPEVGARAEETLGKAAYAVFEATATQDIFAPLLGESRCRMLPYGLDLKPIDAKRNGFDAAAARREAGLPADSRVVVCIGTIEPRKAQIPLAQAFSLIAERHPEANLAFVGGRKKDPHTKALQKWIATAPGGEQMRVIPITPDVEPWYGMADLLVCASDVESLPRTVLEAMAWETPVLATAVFGLPELIDNGETGWLCEQRDTADLAVALDEILSKPPEIHDRIATRARALVEQRHSLPKYAEEISKLLEQAANSRSDEAQRRITSA